MCFHSIHEHFTQLNILAINLNWIYGPSYALQLVKGVSQLEIDNYYKFKLCQ